MTTEQPMTLKYPCPGCAVDLSTHFDLAESWQKCPRCGRASLPPHLKPKPTPLTPVVLAKAKSKPQPDSKPKSAVASPEIQEAIFHNEQLGHYVASEVPAEIPASSKGINFQRILIMVALLVAAAAIFEGVVSQSPLAGSLGFFLVILAFLWMFLFNVRL